MHPQEPGIIWLYCPGNHIAALELGDIVVVMRPVGRLNGQSGLLVRLVLQKDIIG